MSNGGGEYIGPIQEAGSWKLPRADQVDTGLRSAFEKLNEDFYSQTGTYLNVTDSYRTNAEQADLYKRKPNLAARPGHSQHEHGRALDIDQNQIKEYGLDKWGALLEHHGFVRPALSKGETWHIELPRFEQAGKIAAETGVGGFLGPLDDAPVGSLLESGVGEMLGPIEDAQPSTIPTQELDQEASAIAGMPVYRKPSVMTGAGTASGQADLTEEDIAKRAATLPTRTQPVPQEWEAQASRRMPIGEALSRNVQEFAKEAIAPMKGSLGDLSLGHERLLQKTGLGPYGPAGYGTETAGIEWPAAKKYAEEELVTMPGRVLGTVASYFAPGKVAEAVVGVGGLGRALLRNVLTFVPPDIGRALSEGGPDALKQTLWHSPLTAAFFTVAGLPAGKAAQALGVGAAGAASAATAGERDPAKLAEAAGTLILLHKLMGIGQGGKPEEVVKEFVEAHNVTEPEMEGIRNILKTEMPAGLPTPGAETEAVVGGALRPEEVQQIQKERLTERVAQHPEFTGERPQTREKEAEQKKVIEEAGVTFLGSGPFIQEEELRRLGVDKEKARYAQRVLDMMGVSEMSREEIPRVKKALPFIHTFDDIHRIAHGAGTVKLYHGAPKIYADSLISGKPPEWGTSSEDMGRYVAKLYDIPYTEFRNKTGADIVIDSYRSAKVHRLSTAPAEVATRWATSFPYGEVMTNLNTKARIYTEAKRRGVDPEKFHDDLWEKYGGPDTTLADRAKISDKMKDKRTGGVLVELEVDARALPDQTVALAKSYLSDRRTGREGYDELNDLAFWNTNYQDIKIDPSNVKSAKIVADLTPEARYEPEYRYSGGPETTAWFREQQKNLGPVWRSRMQGFLTDKLPGRAAGMNLANVIEGWAGKGQFKADELKWSGLLPWLREQKGPVAKQQVLDFLEGEGRVEVRKVEKSGANIPQWQEHEDGSYSLLAGNTDYRLVPVKEGKFRVEWNQGRGIASAGRYMNFGDAADFVEQRVQELGGPGETKFQGFMKLPPGGNNYREVLLTVPTEAKPDPKGIAKREAVFDKYQNQIDDLTRRINQIGGMGQVERGRLQQKRDAIEEKRDREADAAYSFPETQKYRVPEGHGYGDPAADVNRFAHIFMDDRVIDGKKYLTIWEMQSDWAQEGRRKGYAGPEAEAAKRELTRLKDERRQILYDDRLLREYATQRIEFESKMDAAQREWNEVDKSEMDTEDLRSHPLFQKWSNIRDRYIDTKLAHEDRARSLTDNLDRQIADIEAKGVEGLTPQFPFSKNWHEVALKKALRMAAEEGYDGVAWATGDMVRDRYDLSKQVDQIMAAKNDNGTFNLTAYPIEYRGSEDVVHVGGGIPADKLHEYVGKDLADKISKQTEPFQNYKGDDLKVGGEWANRQYDQMMPQFLNKYGKQWGARVGEGNLGEYKAGASGIQYRIKQSLDDGKYYLSDANTGRLIGGAVGNTKAEAEAYLKKYHDLDYEKIHTLPITPEMKASVLHEGQYLFSGGPETGDWFKDYKNAGSVPIPTRAEIQGAIDSMVQSGTRPDVAMAKVAVAMNRSILDVKKLLDDNSPAETNRQSAVQGQMKALEVAGTPEAHTLQQFADALVGPGTVAVGREKGTDVPKPFRILGGDAIQPGMPRELKKDITYIEQQFMSPNIVAANRFSSLNNPTNDYMTGNLVNYNNRMKYEGWLNQVRTEYGLTDDVSASEKALRDKLGPVFQDFLWVKKWTLGQLGEIDALKDQLKKNITEGEANKIKAQIAEKERMIKSREEGPVAKEELNADYGKDRVSLSDIYAKRAVILKELMKQHPNIRIKMAASGNEDAIALLTPKEREVVAKTKEYYQMKKGQLDAQGLRTREDDYTNFVIRHGLAHNDPGAAAFVDNLWWFKKSKKTPVMMDFISRTPGSQDWFPLWYQSMKAYIPSVERKLAFNPFLTKWIPQVYKWKAQGYDNAAKWLEQFVKRNFSSEGQTGLDRVLNSAVNLEYLRTLGFNLSPPALHLAKLLQTPAWHGPTAFAKGLLRYTKAIGMKALDIQGPERQILETYVRMQPLVRAIEQSPGMDKMLKAEFWRRLPLAATSLIEHFDNGVNLFANIERGLSAGKSPAFINQMNLDTLMRLNFRGYTMPAVTSGPTGRMVTMYTGQPGKLLENKGDLLHKVLVGRSDVDTGGRTRRDEFGDPYLNKAIRMFVAYGALVAGGSAIGLDLHRHAFHAPGVVMSKESGEETFAPFMTPPLQLFESFGKYGMSEGGPARGAAEHFLDVPAVNRILNIMHGEIPEKFRDNPLMYLTNVPKAGWKEDYQEVKEYQRWKEAKQHPYRAYYKKSATQRWAEDMLEDLGKEKKDKKKRPGFSILNQ